MQIFETPYDEGARDLPAALPRGVQDMADAVFLATVVGTPRRTCTYVIRIRQSVVRNEIITTILLLVSHTAYDFSKQ